MPEACTHTKGRWTCTCKVGGDRAVTSQGRTATATAQNSHSVFQGKCSSKILPVGSSEALREQLYICEGSDRPHCGREECYIRLDSVKFGFWPHPLPPM